MRPETVSQTAIGTAIGRALETFYSEGTRLFEDPYAMQFLSLRHRTLVRLLKLPLIGSAMISLRERQVPGVMGNLLCRTRFIDDKVREALSKNFQQFAILGAGLDSRAYRILAAEQIPIFEVDHPATQAWKQKRLEHLPKDAVSQVVFVPVDFEREDLGDALAASKFRKDKKTFLVWEGVTQ